MSKLEDFFIKHRGYFVVLGAFLLNLTVGNLYTYNNMAPFIVRYMQNKSYSGNDVNIGNAVWIFGMGIFGMGSSITLGDVIVKRLGPSMTVLFAGWLMSTTVFMMTYTLKTYLTVVVITYGFINGVGTGIVYGVTINTGCNWFPNRKGTAAGIIVAGFGFSAFIIDIMQSKFVIKQTVYDSLDFVPTSYLLMGCVFLLLQFIGSMLLTNPPGSMSESISPKYVANILGLSMEEDNHVNIKPHNLLMELDFWILWFTYSLLSACFTLIVSLHKEFGTQMKISDVGPIYKLTFATSLGSLCNGLGRIFWGLVIDKVRYKVVMLIMTISLAILLATFYMPMWIYNVTDNGAINGITSIYFIWTILLYFIPSGMFAIFPYTCYKLFGQKNFVANYGMLFTAFSLGGLITSCITSSIWFKDSNRLTLFQWAFTSGSVMAVLATLITLIYRGRSLIRNSGYI